MEDKATEESKLHYWTIFTLKVITISITLLTILYVVALIIAHVFGKRTTVLGGRLEFATGAILSGLVLVAGHVIVPLGSDAICLNSSGPACVPIAGSILAFIDIVLAGFIIYNTEGFEMHS